MKKKIRRFTVRMLRKIRYLPPKIYAHFLYEYYTGKRLNLQNPIEFNEKIQWYKIFYHPEILTQLVDKYAVRAYVKTKIGEEYLNDIYGVYNSADAIPYDTLPQQFVIKATHSSGHNLIVTDKAKLNQKKTNRLLNKWLGINQYYRAGQEWAYKDVAPRLIVEKFISDDKRASLTDYKIYCFGGKVKFVEVHIDRAKKLKAANFDLNFNELPFNKLPLENRINEPIDKPSNYDEMVELSEKLSEDFPFVRVDFYSVKGRTIFGEMTFYPSDGRKDYEPDEYNAIIGSYFKLPELQSGQKYITEMM